MIESREGEALPGFLVTPQNKVTKRINWFT
mgnify:CR=1 FL=1